MMKSVFINFVILIFVLCFFIFTVSAQQNPAPQAKSQEVSDIDGVPVIIKPTKVPAYFRVTNDDAASRTFLTFSLISSPFSCPIWSPPSLYSIYCSYVILL
jgi:hypothetical protein